jgi:hypothetical protein
MRVEFAHPLSFALSLVLPALFDGLRPAERFRFRGELRRFFGFYGLRLGRGRRSGQLGRGLSIFYQPFTEPPGRFRTIAAASNRSVWSLPVAIPIARSVLGTGRAWQRGRKRVAQRVRPGLAPFFAIAIPFSTRVARPGARWRAQAGSRRV